MTRTHFGQLLHLYSNPFSKIKKCKTLIMMVAAAAAA
jgi:hypothetical protein